MLQMKTISADFKAIFAGDIVEARKLALQEWELDFSPLTAKVLMDSLHLFCNI